LITHNISVVEYRGDQLIVKCSTIHGIFIPGRCCPLCRKSAPRPRLLRRGACAEACS